MKQSSNLIRISWLIFFLAAAVALAGLFWPANGVSFSAATLHGETVQISGQGLYHFDTLLGAATFRSTDAVTLLFALPLLFVALRRYQQKSLRGGFLLLGALMYFLYNSASLALSAAYNPLFLAYIVYFSLSLFAFILAFMQFDLARLPALVRPEMPHRGISAFLLIVGVVLFFIWAIDPILALTQGGVPGMLDSYTTVVTYVLDMGLIAPAVILTGILLRRHEPLAYPLAAALLILNSLIGLVVIGQTILQMWMGVFLTPAQIAAFVVSFILMSLFAARMVSLLLKNIAEPA